MVTHLSKKDTPDQLILIFAKKIIYIPVISVSCACCVLLGIACKLLMDVANKYMYI